MSLIPYNKLRCDGCGAIFEPDAPAMDDPRRQRARARRAGWQRLAVKVGEHETKEWGNLPNGKYGRTGRMITVADFANRDLCPACLEELELTPLEEGEPQ